MAPNDLKSSWSEPVPWMIPSITAHSTHSASKIVKAMVWERVIVSLVPVMVIEYVPAGALDEMVIVRVADAGSPDDGVTEEDGVKAVVTPVRAGEVLNATGELKPPSDVTVTMDVAELPLSMTKVLGDTVSKKSGEPAEESVSHMPAAASTVHSTALTIFPLSLMTSIL